MINLSSLSSISILCFFTCFLFADEASNPSKSNLQLIKVASLNTMDANKEFQKNVQLVQQQRALAAQILTKLNGTTDKQEKQKLVDKKNAELTALHARFTEQATTRKA